MRVVIYDEESLEPITVIDLPGLSDMALHERRDWRVAVQVKEPHRTRVGEAPRYSDSMRFVDLKFEQISRVTLTHGEQLTWLCLTRATELAMLLTPDWLPGQRPAIQQLQDENSRLADLIASTLMSVPENE
ncbi:MAG: hypothetical protein IT550_06225 [Novosphingobium sp.]|nr:hypothetical protein [Novosphingobium sp.]